MVDPAEKSGVRVLHLGTSEYFKKFEVESSDGLVWTLKNEKDSKLKFPGGVLREGYFAGPYHKYWETAARRLEYDGKVWIYIHGPEKVIGDKAYDSDPLDKHLAEERGVEMIAPHKDNRCQDSTQDGRALRRYRKRWKIERLFAWLQNFRRLVVRYEYHLENFLAMVQLGCIVILLRRVLG